uniref:SAF domain-containing protein n=1 Tax=Thermus caliditerrae TaxID=1330700 RepID=A0A7C5VH93_9DEIN
MSKAMAHRRLDHVAVAVFDLEAGEEVDVVFSEGGDPLRLRIQEDIPLGHKVALKDIQEGEVVVEYGEAIGRATAFIPAGGYVHVHNLKSLRWDFGGRR